MKLRMLKIIMVLAFVVCLALACILLMQAEISSVIAGILMVCACLSIISSMKKISKKA